jgi:hypothetical protein
MYLSSLQIVHIKALVVETEAVLLAVALKLQIRLSTTGTVQFTR